jgi:hypothetical protein
MDELWAKKANFTLSEREVPCNHETVTNQVKSVFLVPVVRQYLDATTENLKQTGGTIVSNFRLYKHFC